MEHIEEAGIHSGDSACCLPPHSLSARDGRSHQDAGPRAGARARRARPDERPVRRAARRPRHLHPRGQPARVAHGAVRVEGDRRAAGQGGGAHRGRQDSARDGHQGSHAQTRRGQGGGVPVREVRGRRHHPRPGDALDRRGHGHRHQLRRPRSARARLARAPSCRRAAARSCRCRTATRRAPSRSPRGSSTSASRSSPPSAPTTSCAGAGVDVKRVNKVREGRPHIVDRIARRRHPSGHQHDLGRAGDQGFVPDPPQRPAQGHPLLHDAVGGPRRRGRHRRAARGQDDGALAAGVSGSGGANG